MRATWPGAKSGRMAITTLPLVVSSVSVSSGLAIVVSFRIDGSRRGWREPASALDRRLLHEVHAREVLAQIGIAFALQAALVGTAAVWRALAVFGIERVDNVHAGNDLAEGRKARLVQPAIIGKVDEHL